MTKRRVGSQIWQFDSRALKVGNCPDFLTCRWRSTYHWKSVNEGYNFALDFISIEGLHTKLWLHKITRVPTLKLSGLALGSFETKWHVGASPMARHIVYHKGEGGGSPKVQAVLSLMSLCLPMARLSTKNIQITH
jgi:hypothetical protein